MHTRAAVAASWVVAVNVQRCTAFSIDTSRRGQASGRATLRVPTKLSTFARYQTSRVTSSSTWPSRNATPPDVIRRGLIGMALLKVPGALAVGPDSGSAAPEAQAKKRLQPPDDTIGTRRFGGTISTSPSDPRSYRALQLANGLEVLIVTDPLALSAAVSMDVRVGHYSDPRNFPGLAHFCEHMLFLGTSAFPLENSFREFLSFHGGSSNAYTGAEDTNYFFDLVIKKSRRSPLEAGSILGAKGALARFASFFTAPLFAPAAVAREINAVDSEHRNNLQSDAWRLQAVHKAAHANPDHPLSGFGTGSKDTLLPQGQAESGPALMAALRSFWEAHYVASLMTLAVVSPLPADDVQAAVEENFRGIRSRSNTTLMSKVISNENAAVVAIAPPEASWRSQGIVPYLVQKKYGFPLSFAVLAKPVAPMRALKVTWPLLRPNPYTGYTSESSSSLVVPFGELCGGDNRVPSEINKAVMANAANVLGKPGLIVSHLIGHEGPMSLLALLKAKGYVNGLLCSANYEDSDTQLIEVTVALTELGLVHWEEVAELVFGFVALLITDGCPTTFIDECISLAAYQWRFQEPVSPSGAASSFAARMQSLRATLVETPTLLPPSLTQELGATASCPYVLGPERYVDGSALYLNATTATTLWTKSPKRLPWDKLSRFFLRRSGQTEAASMPLEGAGPPPLATSASLKPLIEDVLKRLTPRAATLMLVAPEFEVEETSASSQVFPALTNREKWYRTPWRTVSTQALLERCGDGSSSVNWLTPGGCGILKARARLPTWVRCPGPNVFVPTSCRLKAPVITDDPAAALAALATQDEPAGGKTSRPLVLASVGEAERERQVHPCLLVDDGRWRLWHKQDRSFGVPRGYLIVLLATPAATGDVTRYVASKLWTMAVTDALAPRVYDAALAGLAFDLTLNERGVRLTFSGPDQTLAPFVDLVCTAVRGFDYVMKEDDSVSSSPAAVFARHKELVGRELESMDSQQPWQTAKYFANSVSRVPHYSREGLRAALAAATFEGVKQHARELWAGPGAGTALAEGNLAPTDAHALASTLATQLHWAGPSLHGNFLDAQRPLNKAYQQFEQLVASRGALSLLPRARVRLYPTGPEVQLLLMPKRTPADATSETPGDVREVPCAPTVTSYPYLTVVRRSFDPRNVNSAVFFEWQFPTTSAAFRQEQEEVEPTTRSFGSSDKEELPTAAEMDLACAAVLATILEDAAFTELRTRQQLGYLVSATLRRVEDVASLLIIVQSASFNPSLLHDRVAAFVDSIPSQVISPLSPQKVKKTAAALASQARDPDKRLAQQVGRHWAEIAAGTRKWGRRRREAASFDKVSKSALLAFVEAYMSAASPQRRSLVVHVTAGVEKEESAEPSGDDSARSASKLNSGFLEEGRLKSLPASALLLADLEAFRDALPLIPSPSATDEHSSSCSW